MAVEFWWWPMLPWLSPGAAWFIFFNIVVGAIAIMSRGEQGGRAPATRRKLVRTASTVVMERLRSISIFSFHSAADYGVASSPASQLGHIQDQYDYTSQEQEAEEERLLSRVATEIGKPEPAPAAGESGESATTAAPSAPVTTTAAAADAAESASESEEEEEAEAEDDEESISLDEAYALARQSHAQARQAPPAAVAAVADTVARPREREPAKLAGVKRRACACGRGAEEVEGKAEVNARAELFIRQFRKELKLQRLNSILNYTNELRRRGGAAPAR